MLVIVVVIVKAQIAFQAHSLVNVVVPPAVVERAKIVEIIKAAGGLIGDLWF